MSTLTQCNRCKTTKKPVTLLSQTLSDWLKIEIKRLTIGPQCNKSSVDICKDCATGVMDYLNGKDLKETS